MEEFALTHQAHLNRRPIRLAILECDTPLDKAKALHGGYGAIFQGLLNASGSPFGASSELLQINTWNVQSSDCAYPDAQCLDAILITGSSKVADIRPTSSEADSEPSGYDAWSDAPWIRNLVSYVGKVLSEKSARVIGVCFGHQIVGRALGAPVGRAPEWEVGVVEIPLTPVGEEVFQQGMLKLHQMHQDAVFGCPLGVELLGATDRCPVQGFFVRESLLTLQGHPEVDSDIMSEVVDSRYKRGIFTKSQWLETLHEVKKSHDGIVVGQAFLRFLLS